MSKPSDRLFHLIVSAFALTLTAVSGITVYYQGHPDEVKSWIKPLQQAPWLSKLGVTNMTNHTAQSTKPPIGNTSPTSTSNHVTGSQPAFTPIDNARLLHVSAYGSDVSTAEIQNVKDLLSTYATADVISKSLRMNLPKPVHIYLAQNATDYKDVLAWLGVSISQAQRFSQDTGGFTQGDSIVIPLYQNKAKTDLANSLGHELTHAFLNYNIADSLPSWVNEGTAVTLGMEFQQLASDSPVEYEGYARQMEESVLDATKAGKLIPLTADESKVLAGDTDYDLELQDWLAVRYIIARYGYAGLDSYLQRLAHNESENTAFAQTFGMNEAVFNSTFTNLLNKSVTVPDSGVKVSMEVPPSFRGYVRILQHGAQTWEGFRPATGHISFTLNPAGILTGQALIHTVKDTSPADETTTYIDLDSDNALTYDGQPVSNCGFAIDYHYGTYAFVNAWVTYQDGKSVYLQEPALFGVTLTNVEEGAKNELLTLITTPKP